MTEAAERAQARGVLSMVGLQLPAHARRSPTRASSIADGTRSGTMRHIRAQLPAGLDRRPELPAGLAAAEGPGGLRRARRHRRAHRRPRALPHRPAADRGLRPPRRASSTERPLPGDRDRRAAAASGGVEVGEVTVDDAAVFFGRTDGGALATFEATRFATGRKNAHAHRGQRLARQHRLRLRVDERAPGVRRHRRRRRRGVPPHPGDRARTIHTPAPGGLLATDSATSTRSSTRSPTSSATSPPARRPRRRSPTGCTSSGCWTRSSGPRRTTPPGPRSDDRHHPTPHERHQR